MYFINVQLATYQARRGQLNLAAVYFGVLQRQTAAFSGQHLRQWRISITTMTGIGLTGASAGGEGKEGCVRGAVKRVCGGRWWRGACERGFAGHRAGVTLGHAAAPAMMNEGRPRNSAHMGFMSHGRLSISVHADVM